MDDKVLFVDDEPHILDSMKRQLRKRFNISTAQSGQEALEKCKNEGPFSVVVSDMRMPGMDGIELLTNIKGIYPDTVRLMLTGNADQGTAIEAVNKGQIFRFLNKPCPITVLAPSLALAIRQYRLITAEKELLDKTLKGSVKVLSELLSFANPAAFSSGLRIRAMVLEIAKELAIDNLWQLEIAALMSQIGCVTIPPDILNKLYTNTALDEEEQEMYFHHPQVGAKLLENIPRLEGVAKIIRNQFKDYHEYGTDAVEDEELSLSAQILHALFDYHLLIFQGSNHVAALRLLRKKPGKYNENVLKLMDNIEPIRSTQVVQSMPLKDLTVGMVVEEPIYSRNDTLLVPKGQEITFTVLQGLKNFSRKIGVKEPIRVII